MDYLPLFLNLNQKRVLVVGGNDVAQRKVTLLLVAGASIRLVAPEIKPELYDMVNGETHQILQREYHAEDCMGVRLVVAATNSDRLNSQIAGDAEKLNLFTNVVDGAEQGSAIMPAIIDRSPFIIALSSGGKAPVLARLLRTRLEALIPQGYGRLAQLAGLFRDRVKEKFGTINDRRYFWEKALTGAAAEAAMAGDQEKARTLMAAELEEHSEQAVGEVYLVGGGPGDPDLLTFKALRLMQQADVVLYDRLVSPEVLALCRRDADMVYVGKKRDQHVLPQEKISQLLARYALEGRRVLRLKGGDPFIFGRGGEEIETLAAKGIPFQVVPGITAASGCASYAGIPLTHRDFAESVRFVTGHIQNGSIDLPWREMLDDRQTLVFYMGLMRLEEICRKLINHGRSDSTPVALVQQGTTQKQRVWTGTLATIPGIIKLEAVKPPVLIIIGGVVELRRSLGWFQPEPEPETWR